MSTNRSYITLTKEDLDAIADRIAQANRTIIHKLNSLEAMITKVLKGVKSKQP